jgi:hypothetical protein
LCEFGVVVCGYGVEGAMRYALQNALYRMARWMMAFSYVRNQRSPDDIVIHDLKLRVQEQQREILRLRLENVITRRSSTWNRYVG